MHFLRILPVALLLLAADCGNDPPPVAAQKVALTFTNCPTSLPWAYWGFACYPSNNECLFGEYHMQYIVNGRLIERTWYRDSSGQRGGDFYSSWCLDTSPWPTSWTGPMEVYQFSDPYTIYTWKKEHAPDPNYPFAGCHCYTSTNGFNWSARTCYGWECD